MSGLFEFDVHWRQQGFSSIAGVDEAGRGPWAGPAVAAAVILPAECFIAGVNDSKQISDSRRRILFDEIHRVACAVGVGIADHSVIDTINILQATYAAMKDAIAALGTVPNLVLVDGYKIADMPLRQEGIVQGDAKSASIAAASIIAKVTRDRIMEEYALQYPQYQFERHKGYGTARHRAALKEFGPCPIRRRSFSPIMELSAIR